MKIIQINCVYGNGSTGMLVKSLKEGLESQGNQCFVLYGRGEFSKDRFTYKFSSEIEAKFHSLLTRLTGVDFGYSLISTNRVIKILKRMKPDVVHLHCLNGHCINVYKLISYLKKNQIKTVLTLHADIMHTAGCEHAINCEKWRERCYDCDIIKGKLTRYFRDDAAICYDKMKRCFNCFPELTVVGVSNWLTNRAKSSQIFRDSNCRFSTVLNGVDIDIFKRIICNDEYIKKIKNEGRPLLLYLTPNFYHHLKGGNKVLKFAEMHPEWDFLMVGVNEKKNDWPANIKCIKHTKDNNELVMLYNIADITIVMSLRETFSMVCAESLCCGTPVVGFKSGGPESFLPHNNSAFVDQDDYYSLGVSIKALLEKKYRDEDYYSNRDFLSKNRMIKEYYELYLSK